MSDIALTAQTVDLASGAEVSLSASVSAGNSSTTPLAGGATFTGTWTEGTIGGGVIVRPTTDVAGTLYIDFSSDGTNIDSTVTGSSGLTSTFAPMSLGLTSRYFRVRYVNGASAQGSFRLQTLITPTQVLVISSAAQTIGDYNGVLLVREAVDRFLDEAAGLQADRVVVQKFGRTPSVGTSGGDVWSGSGFYTGFLTAASTVRIASGGNVNDTAAGTGARSIRVVGLDENWEEASEDIVTAGASASAATTTTFIRLFRAYVLTSGTYGGGAAGTITIQATSAGTPTLANLDANPLGQTQLALYTVPAHYTAYMRSCSATVEGGKTATVYFRQRQNADVVAAPFTAPREWATFAGLSGYAQRTFQAYPGPFPEKTDIWVSAYAGTGTAAVSATMDIVLRRT